MLLKMIYIYIKNKNNSEKNRNHRSKVCVCFFDIQILYETAVNTAVTLNKVKNENLQWSSDVLILIFYH